MAGSVRARTHVIVSNGLRYLATKMPNLVDLTAGGDLIALACLLIVDFDIDMTADELFDTVVAVWPAIHKNADGFEPLETVAWVDGGSRAVSERARAVRKGLHAAYGQPNFETPYPKGRRSPSRKAAADAIVEEMAKQPVPKKKALPGGSDPVWTVVPDHRTAEMRAADADIEADMPDEPDPVERMTQHIHALTEIRDELLRSEVVNQRRRTPN